MFMLRTNIYITRQQIEALEVELYLNAIGEENNQQSYYKNIQLKLLQQKLKRLTKVYAKNVTDDYLQNIIY